MFTITEAEKSKFITALAAKMKRMEQACGEVFRGYTLAVYHRILTETPQYSGNAVANWNVSADQPDYKTSTAWKHNWTPPPLSKGVTLPTMDSVHRNSAIFAGPFDVNKHYYIANKAENLDKKTYIQLLERNPNSFLRPVNSPGHMIEYTANSARSLGVLDPAKVESLRKLAPGQFGNPGVGL